MDQGAKLSNFVLFLKMYTVEIRQRVFLENTQLTDVLFLKLYIVAGQNPLCKQEDGNHFALSQKISKGNWKDKTKVHRLSNSSSCTDTSLVVVTLLVQSFNHSLHDCETYKRPWSVKYLKVYRDTTNSDWLDLWTTKNLSVLGLCNLSSQFLFCFVLAKVD